MTATEYADRVAASGECPGCLLPFTQVSVEDAHHSRYDGAPLRAGDWMSKDQRCPWSSDDLFSLQLISTRVVVER